MHLRGRQNVVVVVFFAKDHHARDSKQPVAHWFVSCIDSVNRAMKYFDPPI